MDPIEIYEFENGYGMALIYEKYDLVVFEPGHGENFAVVVSEDWEFMIEEGATFDELRLWILDLPEASLADYLDAEARERGWDEVFDGNLDEVDDYA